MTPGSTVASGIYNETDDDDCDDTRAAVSPAGGNLLFRTMTTDGDDNDEGAVGASTWYADVDGDGFGTGGLPLVLRGEGVYNELDDDDCDDGNATVYARRVV